MQTRVFSIRSLTEGPAVIDGLVEGKAITGMLWPKMIIPKTSGEILGKNSKN